MNLRPVVRWFAEAMESRLRDNDWKGGWLGYKQSDLIDKLEDRFVGLANAVENGTPKAIQEEAFNLANFALMIADMNGFKMGQNGDQVL